MRIVVDLPDPLGPRKPVTVPGRTSKDRSSTATTLPNRLESPRASITRSALHGAMSSGYRVCPVGGVGPGCRPTGYARMPTRSAANSSGSLMNPVWPPGNPWSSGVPKAFGEGRPPCVGRTGRQRSLPTATTRPGSGRCLQGGDVRSVERDGQESVAEEALTRGHPPRLDGGGGRCPGSSSAGPVPMPVNTANRSQAAAIPLIAVGVVDLVHTGVCVRGLGEAAEQLSRINEAVSGLAIDQQMRWRELRTELAANDVVLVERSSSRRRNGPGSPTISCATSSRY